MTTTHGQHQMAEAAAVAAQDATRLEPLVHFFYLFFFIYYTNVFFRFTYCVRMTIAVSAAGMFFFSLFIYLLH